MNILNFSITFFFTLLNITILFVIMRAIFFKPITKFIAAREAKIKGELEHAAADREEARNLRELYDQKLQQAEIEAQNLVESARKTAETRAAQILAEGKGQAETLVAAARKQIAAEQQAAFLVFRAEAAALVVQAAGRLLHRELSSDDLQMIADTAIKECAVPRTGRLS